MGRQPATCKTKQFRKSGIFQKGKKLQIGQKRGGQEFRGRRLDFIVQKKEMIFPIRARREGPSFKTQRYPPDAEFSFPI